jgi:hypothetical protein
MPLFFWKTSSKSVCANFKISPIFSRFVGKIEEVLGPVNEVYFSVVLDEGKYTLFLKSFVLTGDIWQGWLLVALKRVLSSTLTP